MRFWAFLLVGLYWLQLHVAQEAETGSVDSTSEETVKLLSIEELIKLPVLEYCIKCVAC